MFAPAFTACCSTAIVAMDVVTIPLATVDGSPAFKVSSESAFHIDADVLLDPLDHLSCCDGRRTGHVRRGYERRGGCCGSEGGEFASGQVSHVMDES